MEQPFVPNVRKVFMFSGQGSQYYHMGRALYDENYTFRNWMLRLDDLVEQLSGRSVIRALYSETHGRGDPFDRTLLTHPAIFMVEYSLAQTLIHAGIRPDMVLGVSMGSFAAATVAGFIDAENALTAVMRQATALEECCEPGGMTAILADPAMFEEAFLSERSELAAVNFSSHFVISAREPELVKIESVLRRQNVGFQRLPVSLPFHSQWMDQAKAPFESFMRSIRCSQGRLPLVCCDQTAILRDLPEDYFWSVVRHPIRFRETIALLEQDCISRYIDVGPAGTLATFLKYGMPSTTKSIVHAILTPFGFDSKNLATLLSSISH